MNTESKLEPIMSSATLVNAGIKIAPGALKMMHQFITEAWANSRLSGFISSLGEALELNDSDAIGEMLKKIEGNTKAHENIPEMIRSICVGKSKNYAPKICALYVARIIRDDLILSEFQSKCIAAISDLYDDEIDNLWHFLQEHPIRVKNRFARFSKGAEEYVDVPEIESEIHRATNGGSSYFSLATTLGRWAVVFEEFQLIGIQQTDRMDLEGRDDVGRSISTKIYIDAEIRELEGYIKHVRAN